MCGDDFVVLWWMDWVEGEGVGCRSGCLQRAVENVGNLEAVGRCLVRVVAVWKGVVGSSM